MTHNDLLQLVEESLKNFGSMTLEETFKKIQMRDSNIEFMRVDASLQLLELRHHIRCSLVDGVKHYTSEN